MIFFGKFCKLIRFCVLDVDVKASGLESGTLNQRNDEERKASDEKTGKGSDAIDQSTPDSDTQINGKDLE